MRSLSREQTGKKVSFAVQRQAVGNYCKVLCVMNVVVLSDTGREELELKSSGSKVEIMEKPVDVRRNRYPYCIVWTPLPLIT